jgi:hypothetical protein
MQEDDIDKEVEEEEYEFGDHSICQFWDAKII